MEKKILIVCFDTPYPSNYGGAIDIERKFNYFKARNIKIDLICTCFDHERKVYFEKFIQENKDIFNAFHIELINVSIFKAFLGFNFLPFSVIVRKFKFDKISFLKSSTYDMVVVEHMKTTYQVKELGQTLTKKGVKPDFWLRLHNDEAAYYRNMFKASKSWKAIFFWSESLKYNRYQRKVLKDNLFKGFLYISTNDLEKFTPYTSANSINKLLPIFQEVSNIQRTEQKEIDLFYVGNLELEDNIQALKRMIFFIEKHQLQNYKIVIAGKCSSSLKQQKIRDIFKQNNSISFQFNVPKDELDRLFKNAKFFLNFSANESGVKTKLIEAIDYQIPVISNQEGVVGSGYEELVILEDKLEITFLHQLLESHAAYNEYLKDYTFHLNQKVKSIVRYYDEWWKA